jgi:hypothetical protein
MFDDDFRALDDDLWVLDDGFWVLGDNFRVLSDGTPGYLHRLQLLGSVPIHP